MRMKWDSTVEHGSPHFEKLAHGMISITWLDEFLCRQILRSYENENDGQDSLHCSCCFGLIFLIYSCLMIEIYIDRWLVLLK